MAHVIEVDPHDERMLRAFWQNEQAGHLADRDRPVLRTYDALANTMREPSPYYHHLLLAVVEDGSVVAGADLGYPTVENTHLASLEIHVRPDRRRRGLGTALHEVGLTRVRDLGRTTVIGEVYEPVNPAPAGASSAAMAFALGHGYASVHVEHRMALPLPAGDALPLEEDGYRVVTWADRCPEEHLSAYCAMSNQMAVDVPTGALDFEPVVVDEGRVRTSEERTMKSYRRLVAAVVRLADGRMVGYSEMFLPHGETYVLQDDTLVMPEHRGRGLGRRLKLANLDVLRREYPERRVVHTWTAPDNVAMVRTNEKVGFRTVERMHEMQRKLA